MILHRLSGCLRRPGQVRARVLERNSSTQYKSLLRDDDDAVVISLRLAVKQSLLP
jgi:hypothetical protein